VPNPVTWFEIVGRDGKKLQDFYASLLDWKIDANNPMNYGMVPHDHGDGEHGIGGGIAGSQDATTAMVTVYVEVADIPATLKKAESMGGKTVMPQMDVPGGPTIAQFADPEGNVIGLMKAGSMGQ